MQQVLEDFCGRTLTDTKEPLKTLPNYITTKFKTEEKKFSTALTTKEYLFGKDLINQDKMLKAIEEVIVQVKGKGLV